MKELKPSGEIALDHRAEFLRGFPGRSNLICGSESGRITIISADLKTTVSTTLPSGLRSICPHPSARKFAWIDSAGKLSLQNIDGTARRTIDKSLAPAWQNYDFDHCMYDLDGSHLWLLSNMGDVCQIQLISDDSLLLVAASTIEDPFGGSAALFYDTGLPGLVSLWFAAGQDGQQVYLLKSNETGFSCTTQKQLTDVTPPVFSPSGSHFAVISSYDTIRAFNFPQLEEVGAAVWNDDDDSLGCHICYINENQCLVHTNEGRLFSLQTKSMSIGEEVALEGHEPLPAPHYYPALQNETGLCTDISYFERFGDVIFFVYRRDRGRGAEGWQDALVYFRCDRNTML